jgi:outer membrane biosynthesis protein TonB
MIQAKTATKIALPWLIAFAVHAAILMVPVGIIISSAPLALGELGVTVNIAGQAGSPAAGEGGGTIQPGKGEEAQVPRPGPRAGKLPTAASLGGAPKVAYDSPRGVAPLVKPQADAATYSMALPSAQDVLADLGQSDAAASVAPAATPAKPAVGAAVRAPTGAAVTTNAPSVAPSLSASEGTLTQTQFTWEGTSRKLIRKRDPQFPAVLSAAGQEVDCEARIIVSPAGTVMRVEISSASGYIEIDASVEAALRDYLFSRVDGKKDAVGTVKFRFRLEKRD